MSWEYWEYQQSKPRRVKNGGIKARSKKGNIGSTWWSKKWLKILESYGSQWSSNRLKRGISYARMGQIINFEISKGSISASVQGSRPKPYKVIISVKMLENKQWKKAIESMSSQVIYAAKLLAGEMPENIEKAFIGSSSKLFPSKAEFKAYCTCPDSANPCKHIAAVCYIIAEEFDRNPFMIFELRGKSREDILTSLRKARNGGGKQRCYTKEEPSSHIYEKNEKSDNNSNTNDPKPLQNFVYSFWHAGKNYKLLDVSIEPSRVNAAVIKRLGEPSFWRLQKNFVDIMEDIYGKVSKIALKEAYAPLS
ncbi:MAG TPA: SWIM zinc finger family protein [Nitrososphaeraceae archaeon]|nr:SWIM zinc finger family protein [Nitrososphaeraceae archaeon]